MRNRVIIAFMPVWFLGLLALGFFGHKERTASASSPTDATSKASTQSECRPSNSEIEKEWNVLFGQPRSMSEPDRDEMHRIELEGAKRGDIEAFVLLERGAQLGDTNSIHYAIEARKSWCWIAGKPIYIGTNNPPKL